MASWDPNLYLEFDAQRTQPSIDLVSRIALDQPAAIVDLGCGPGNSTAVLARRWPHARIVGVDHSAEMLERARAEHPGLCWVLEDIARWTPAAPCDLVFTNAALQWVPGHRDLLPRLLAFLRPGGALAMQIPYHLHSRVHRIIEETAARFGCLHSVFEILTPGEYYDILASRARRLDLWTTDYIHIVESPAAIVRWMQGTGLRPYLEPLDEAARAAFLAAFEQSVAERYPAQQDGRVLFPFPRLFDIAYV